MKLLTKVISIAAFLAAGAASYAQAEEGQCVMIHVAREDAMGFKQAINIAKNIPKQLGADTVRIEVIAQGPGLKLFTKGSPETDRSKSLAAMGDQTMGGGTKFSACAATMAGIKKKTGKEPELIEGVGVTHPGAAARILELYKEGCAYVRI